MQDLWTDQAKTSDGSELPTVNAVDAANAFITNRNSVVKATSNSRVVQSMGGGSAAEEEFSKSQRQHLSDLLEAWEEPRTAEQKEVSMIVIFSTCPRSESPILNTSLVPILSKRKSQLELF